MEDARLIICNRRNACKKCQLNFVKGDDISGKCVRLYLNDMLEAINNEESERDDI